MLFRSIDGTADDTPEVNDLFRVDTVEFAKYNIDGFQRFFSPNSFTHSETLKRLSFKAAELLYVSRRFSFLKNAMSFMGGTVWITDNVNYGEASRAPDLICHSLGELRLCLERDAEGFLGEIAVYPNPSMRLGMIVPVGFKTRKGVVPLYMLGRYFGHSQYMNQMHPYSAALFWNKRMTSRSYGKFDGLFGGMLAYAAGLVIGRNAINGICAVPSRPGKPDRFAKMLDTISLRYGIENYGRAFVCNNDYPSQKGLSYQERQMNIRGVFSFGKRLHGDNVIILDDIVSTGATVNECVDRLIEAGAGGVFVVVLAVNQLGAAYWS